jgi:membrane protein DedA with SNARE-associated domain
MAVECLIEEDGYIAVFVGAFLEGETVLVLAGFAAHRGHLDLPRVITMAMFAGWLGDQLYFFLGRFYGPQLLARFPSLKPRAERVDTLLHSYHLVLIPAICFMYGLRIVGPIVFGMGRVGSMRFLLLNLLGAAIWAPLITGAGYLFGEAVELILQDVARYERYALAAIVLFGLGAWAWHRWRGK